MFPVPPIRQWPITLSTRPKTGTLNQGLQKLENFLLKSGTVGYSVGNQHTFADIHVLALITFNGGGYYDGIPANYADGFARINSIRQKIAAHEIIKKYYDSKSEKSKYDNLYIKAREFT